MKRFWPPAPLGFGTPLNLAFPSQATRREWKTSLVLSITLGIATPLVILLLDHLLFSGVSIERVRTFGAMPITTRVAIVTYSAVTEELIYRVVLSTLVAWVSYLLFRRVQGRRALAVWLGIVVAAVLFGLAHVGNLSQVPHPVLRAVTLNGLAGLVLGWLYWWRGLESATMAHLVADSVLYLIIPLLL